MSDKGFPDKFSALVAAAEEVTTFIEIEGDEITLKLGTNIYLAHPSEPSDFQLLQALYRLHKALKDLSGKTRPDTD